MQALIPIVMGRYVFRWLMLERWLGRGRVWDGESCVVRKEKERETPERRGG